MGMAKVAEEQVKIEINNLHIHTRNMVVIGHVDAGKSTTSGALQFCAGALDARQVQKLKEKAEAMNRASFFLAYSMDNTKAEQERGITIQTSTKSFNLPSGREIVLSDAPGHADFIMNMITGASNADVALLIVSAKGSEFNAGIDPSGQTSEHILVSNALGIKDFVVAVNKMDDDSVKWSKERFDEIVDTVEKTMRKLGRRKGVGSLTFVPVSGLGMVNIKEVDKTVTPWYKGKSLIETLEELPDIVHDLTRPTRVTVQGVYSVRGIGEVVSGNILQGTIKVNQHLNFTLSGFAAQVKSIEKFHKQRQIAYPGDSIGMQLNKAGGSTRKPIKGDVGTDKAAPLEKVKRLRVRVALTSAFKNGAKLGFKPILHVGFGKCASTLVKFVKIWDKNKSEMQDFRQEIKPGERFEADFQPEHAMLMAESKTDCPALARVLVREQNRTIGVGMVEKIVNEDFDPDFRVVKKKKDEE